jgi:hypothetical protein
LKTAADMRLVDLKSGVALARSMVVAFLKRIMPEVLFAGAFVYMIQRGRVILLPGRYYNVHRFISYPFYC